jgi:hypothetical protein
MFNPSTGKELFQLHETASKVMAYKVMTLGDYLRNVITRLVNGSFIEFRPSSNLSTL